MSVLKIIVAAGLLAGTASQAIANPPVLNATSKPVPGLIDQTTMTDEIGIGRDQADRMTVSVSVAGAGPYRFLVDTGAERTVISRQLAQRLNLASGEAATLHSVIGANGVATVDIPHLRVSNNVVSVDNAPALEAANIGADGMLGIDSLKSQRVLFNFKAKTMSITPAGKDVPDLDGDVIVVRARSRNGRLIFTQAKVDGRKVTIIVDTGSQVSVGNLALQRALSGRKMWRSAEPVMIESVTGDKLLAEVAKLSEIEMGGVHLNDLSIAFTDAHIFKKLDLHGKPALLLGMNALRAFDQISIDFASKKVRFVLPGTSMLGTQQMAAVER
jgi:predicted aspartyl protease